MRSLLPVVPVLACSSLVLTLGAQPNQAPVTTGTIPSLTSKSTAAPTSVYNLTNFFRDPDISAAVRLSTSVGDIPIALYTSAPITVTNFLKYADRSTNGYTGTFIHRVPAGVFVVQGGSFITTTYTDNGTNNAGAINYSGITTDPPIQNEFRDSNLRGTVAMARVGGQPNSATSSWFINMTNNSFLDAVDGGFTVFGRVVGQGMVVADAINAAPKRPLTEIPGRNYGGSGGFTQANLINLNSTPRIPTLSFSASSSAPGVVGVTTSNSDLRLTFNSGSTGSSTITVTATDLDGAFVNSTFTVNVSDTPPQANLANISTRGFVGTGDNALIGGFVVRGSAKRVLIRSLGPSLGAFGITSPLSNPNITLQSGANVIATNDNWKATQQAEIQATGFAPTNDLESAMVVTLQPGSYTPIVRGTGDVTGVAIVEVYELDVNESPQLINISTRGRVGTGEAVMIGGFVIGGTTPKRVLVRAAGPSLAQFGVSGVLADPTLELNAGGRVIAINNDYQVLSDGSPNPDGPAILASGFQPADTHECAIIATLAPGSYTAIVRGVNDSQGVAIVEVYDLD